jgi:hypothetical protein
MAVNAIPVLSPVHKGSRRSEIKCFNVAARENASAKSSIWHAFYGPLALAKRRITPSANIRHLMFIVCNGDIPS